MKNFNPDAYFARLEAEYNRGMSPEEEAAYEEVEARIAKLNEEYMAIENMTCENDVCVEAFCDRKDEIEAELEELKNFEFEPERDDDYDDDRYDDWDRY